MIINQYSETYNDVIAYLDQDERQSLEFAMIHFAGQTDRVQRALFNANLLDPVFQDVDFPLTALRAFKEQKIDGLAFTTSQLFYNALHHNRNDPQLRVVPLFIGQNINPEAWNMVLLSSSEGEPATHYFSLTPARMTRYFELCQRLPRLEQQYLALPKRQRTGSKTIAERLDEIHFTALISYKEKSGQTTRVMASKGMMLAYLKARSEAFAPRMITRFKLSPVDKLRDLICLNARDFCLNFMPLTPVRKADSYVCDLETNDCEAHDWYHTNVFLNVPLMHRIRFYALAVLLENLPATHKQMGRPLAEKLIDMEHRGYIGSISTKTLELVFWKTIARHIRTDQIELVDAIGQEILKNRGFYSSIGIDPVNHVLENREQFFAASRFDQTINRNATMPYTELILQLIDTMGAGSNCRFQDNPGLLYSIFVS